MKNLLIILVLISAVSCTKSINESPNALIDPGLSTPINPPTQKDDNLTRDLGNGVILKIALFPIPVCDANDSSKPCDLFVSILYTLSKPVDRNIQVEVIKTNLVEKNKNTNASDTAETSITVMLEPNTTALTFNSKIQVSPNEKIAPEEFRIGKVAIFQKAD
ncbi:MAG: hypothetical protein V4557_03465 [Bacteroidota bacterium]